MTLALKSDKLPSVIASAANMCIWPSTSWWTLRIKHLFFALPLIHGVMKKSRTQVLASRPLATTKKRLDTRKSCHICLATYGSTLACAKVATARHKEAGMCSVAIARSVRRKQSSWWRVSKSRHLERRKRAIVACVAKNERRTSTALGRQLVHTPRLERSVLAVVQYLVGGVEESHACSKADIRALC